MKKIPNIINGEASLRWKPTIRITIEIIFNYSNFECRFNPTFSRKVSADIFIEIVHKMSGYGTHKHNRYNKLDSAIAKPWNIDLKCPRWQKFKMLTYGKEHNASVYVMWHNVSLLLPWWKITTGWVPRHSSAN